MLPAVLPIQPLHSNNHNIFVGPDNISSNNINSDISGTNNNNSHIGNIGNDLTQSKDVCSKNVAGLVGGVVDTSAGATKNQLEQLNTMREALFSQDGWGCQHVNQDTNWEVPSSPEPANKDPSVPPIWKPTINNGTDLWESNLRNGGQPTTQQVQKPSWGHTPTSNLGGTWGEDDDGADSSSVWTGSVNNPAPASGVNVGASGVGAGVGPGGSGPQWGQNVVGIGMGSTGNGGGGGASSIPVVATGGASSSSGVNTSGSSAAGAPTVSNTGNGWGDPREMRSNGPLGSGPMDMRSDPMRSATSGDPRDLRLCDPRDPIRGDPRGISGRLNGTSEMWGHHQISHNQMPAMNKMVGPVVNPTGANVSVPNANVTGIGPSGVAGGVPGNVSGQWGAGPNVVGPKDITKQVTGWEEPSPPPQRRNIPNFDDGTSLWGQQTRVPGGGSHWKDMSDTMNRGHIMRGQNPASGIVGGNVAGNGNVQVGIPNNPMAAVVGPQARMASVVGPPSGPAHKSDGGMWVHAGGSGRNPSSTWADEAHAVSGSAAPGAGWVDEKANAGLTQIGTGTNSWNDSQSGGGWSSKQPKMPANNAVPGWSNATGGNTGATDANDINTDWSTHNAIVGKPQQQKIGGINVGVSGLNLDMIKQSKQFRILVETGFKKDDVERALINANMNIEEAAEMLRANSSLNMVDGWRRHDETLGSYDHANSTSSGSGFPVRYPTAGVQPSMSFPPNNILNNIGNAAVSGGSNNPNLAALQVQKYLNQGPHSVGQQPANTAFGQGAANATANVNVASNTNNQPSAQQLRMLVQQIQLAVHSGFLSSQILNQPLAPATLMLLNQLLSNIKHLQAAQQSLSRGSNANPLAVNVAIAKYKQQIQNLQNQINAQQAIYIKQQQQQQQHSMPQPNPQQQHPAVPTTHLNNTSNEYLRGHDAISALQGNFTELNLNKQPGGGYQGAPNQQSRLNQWKLPVLEKDMTTDSTDFSRAPGATKQSLTATNTPNMGPLGLQNDGTWSTARNLADGWPDTSTENENKDWSVAQPTTATAYTDLVQEFEPGKPWKGAQIKNIEDDPSITPGSVARSPLSINPTPKDADIFANTSKTSPTDLPPLSLSSSTWSFNPNQNFPSWSDNPQQCATSELWATSLNKTARGPPPGLSTNKAGSCVTVTNPNSVVGNTNGWLTGNRVGAAPNATWSGGNSSWSSNWLLLKNLSAQIDGSTLRTLCMQHGPLVSFHLYLNQGIALCKYATREEASKAQMTLNNCVLGSTTILAESPNESEVQNILQHLPQTPTNASNPGNTTGVVGNGGNTGTGGNSGGGGGGPNNAGPNNVPGNGNNIGGNVSTVVATNIVGSSGGNAHATVSGIVSSGCNNNASNNATSPAINGAGGVAANNSTNSSKNTSICGGGTNSTQAGGGGGSITGQATSVANVTTVVGNNTNWRQTTQIQQTQQQNQTRPSGRETEFDFSQYVCSIVDD